CALEAVTTVSGAAGSSAARLAVTMTYSDCRLPPMDWAMAGSPAMDSSARTEACATRRVGTDMEFPAKTNEQGSGMERWLAQTRRGGALGDPGVKCAETSAA